MGICYSREAFIIVSHFLHTTHTKRIYMPHIDIGVCRLCAVCADLLSGTFHKAIIDKFIGYFHFDVIIPQPEIDQTDYQRRHAQAMPSCFVCGFEEHISLGCGNIYNPLVY